VTAQPQCALKDAQGNKYCCLRCNPTRDDSCGPNASCKSISGIGICTYDDTELQKEDQKMVKLSIVPHHVREKFNVWYKKHEKTYT